MMTSRSFMNFSHGELTEPRFAVPAAARELAAAREASPRLWVDTCRILQLPGAPLQPLLFAPVRSCLQKSRKEEHERSVAMRPKGR